MVRFVVWLIGHAHALRVSNLYYGENIMERSNVISRREIKRALRKFIQDGGKVEHLPAEDNRKRGHSFPSAQPASDADHAAYLANHFGIYLSSFQGS